MEKKYEGFLNSLFKKNQTSIICRRYNITNYTINSDGSIDIYNNVYLSNFNITELPLKFRNVNGYFCCDNNKLTSLVGSPIYVSYNFDCSENNLKNLDGSPTHVSGYFECGNNNITSLEGGPTSVDGNFYCQYNNITSLEGFPTRLSGDFYCEGNPVYELWRLFKDIFKIELFNDYDIIRGTDMVLDRLNDFLITIGKNPVKSVDGYNNI